MSNRDLVLQAVDAGVHERSAIIAHAKLEPKQVENVLNQLRTKGILERGAHGWTRCGAAPAPSGHVHRIANDEERIEDAVGPIPAEDGLQMVFAVDEDGDLLLARRDGEGCSLYVPSAEIARLVAFVHLHFRDALRA